MSSGDDFICIHAEAHLLRFAEKLFSSFGWIICYEVDFPPRVDELIDHFNAALNDIAIKPQDAWKKKQKDDLRL